MASNQYDAGHAHGQAQMKADEWIQSTKDTANAAQDKASNAAQSTKESAQHGQEQASGFIHQTADKAMNMAHGAVDSVKSTLGVGEHSHKK